MSFGHTLACIHEHERPDAAYHGTSQKSIEYYKETDGWSKEDVDAQVFDQIRCQPDPRDKDRPAFIMMYPVPADLTTGGYTVGWNNASPNWTRNI